MPKTNQKILFRLKLTEGITNLQIHNLLKACKERNVELADCSAYDYSVFANLTHTKNTFLFHWKEQTQEWLEEQWNTQPCITIFDKEYPPLLREMHNPPVVLFYQGDISLLQKLTLSVVGSRNPSDVGVQATYRLLEPLTKHFVFVSGLASGIDGIAHKLAIRNHGETIGVIGCGLNVFYPKHHQELQKYMMQHQLVISEYPKDTPPRRHHFPERNRIIAGLSMGCVVIEAKKRSGSLITCEFAMDSGREVFAVPGEILSGRSDGCHHLIQEGAKCTYQTQDILEELV